MKGVHNLKQALFSRGVNKKKLAPGVKALFDMTFKRLDEFLESDVFKRGALDHHLVYTEDLKKFSRWLLTQKIGDNFKQEMKEIKNG